MSLALYYAPASSYCQYVRIALREKALEHEAVEVNLFDEAARARYLEVNPFGKIPTLQDGAELVLEAPIIVEYLDQRFLDTAPLIPRAADDARRVRFFERVLTLYINVSRHELLQALQPTTRSHPADVGRARERLGAGLALLEQRLADHLWLGGSGFTLADCAAPAILHYLQCVYPLDEYPAVCDYMQRLAARVSVAQTIAEAEPQMRRMLGQLSMPIAYRQFAGLPEHRTNTGKAARRVAR
jgi:glutathione S-transferase